MSTRLQGVFSTLWPKTDTLYAVVILPFGDFASIGLRGNTTDTPGDVPTRCRNEHGTLHWAPGVEDGGSSASQRVYPVFGFDDDYEMAPEEELPSGWLAWIPVSDLRPLDDVVGTRTARGDDAAKGFYAALRLQPESKVCRPTCISRNRFTRVHLALSASSPNMINTRVDVFSMGAILSNACAWVIGGGAY